jgi:hypothetical protein
MADIVTGTVSGQLDISDILRATGDIRREQEAIGSNIRRETAKEGSDVIDVVKTSAWANSDRTGTEADRVTNQASQYFIAQQSINFNNATALAALKASTDAQFSATQANIQLAAKDNATATALAAAATQMMIVQEATRGRELAQVNEIANLRQHLSLEYADHRSTLSQLAAQGTVNFGTMSGNAGRNTSTNNVV